MAAINNRHYIPVPDFYIGKSVLVTGATGFLGKACIEKLIYSCDKIDKIYVLIREKKNENIEQRLKKFLDNEIFTRIKKKKPRDLYKIIPIVGDLLESNLGIKEEDEKTLIENVSVVFHSAATIKMNESLRITIKANYEGTIAMLNLCRRMKKLRAFVHISTAYSSTKDIIEEEVCSAPAEIEDVYRFIDTNEDNTEMIKPLLNGLPNTYAFAKALAENYMTKSCRDLPIVIVRPSIVTAAENEPLQGWLDNWNGATSILVPYAKGLMRVLIGHDDNKIDLIPVDYVVNLCIVAAARCQGSGRVSIFNCCTSSTNPMTLRKLSTMFYRESVLCNYGGFPFPMVLYTTYKWIANIIMFVTLTIPAFILDLLLRFRGQQPRYLKLNKKIVLVQKLFEYFTSRTWEIRSNNAIALASSLSYDDKKMFPCNPCELQWSKYMSIYCKGIQKYLLRESSRK